MKHSSRRTPCPVCDRDKDDKCRWNDDFILCYVGNSFSPPGHIKIGDRIKIEQRTYALCSQVSGFAGNSFCFALVDDFDYRFLPYEDKIAYRRQCVKVTRIFMAKHSSAIELINHIANDEIFYEMTANQFYANKNTVKAAISLLTELVEHATANKRHIIDYLQQIKTVIEATRDMRQKLNSIYEFERFLFASPNPDQSDMRGP